MASHGTTEYSTAEGNDYPAHEATYENFVTLVLVGIVHVVSICLGLTIGGVRENWWAGGGIIFFATLAAGWSLMTGSKLPSYVILVLGLIGLAVA
jgi:hypothetical protein